MTQPFVFNSVPRIEIGPGMVSSLPAACAQLRIERPLLVTDRGIVDLGLLSDAQTAMSEAGFEMVVFDAVLADPPEENLFDAVELARQHECDSVIGFGGGSSMDVAKLVAVLMLGGQPLKEMYGVDQVKGDRVPLIQIPTTAGTGSEATAVSIITTGESSKAGVVSATLIADWVILDPVLTLGLPPHVTAATGIDAMVHAIEAYTSIRLKNPLSDMVAHQALRLLSANIEAAVNDGSQVDVRSDMLLGAMLAGQAFANSPVAAVHALAYPLGGTFHIPHGLSNSLMLPHVLKFNAPNCASQYLELAHSIDGVSTDGLTEDTVGDRLAEHFLALAERLGLQTRLRDMDIRESALEDLASQAMDQQRLLINNPREVSYETALQLYQEAF